MALTALQRLIKIWDEQDMYNPVATLAEINKLIREIRRIVESESAVFDRDTAETSRL